MVILSTGSLYTYGLDRVFGLAAKAGYDGVEVLVDARWDTRDPSVLRRLSSAYGIPVAALHSPFVPNIHGWPSGQLGRLKKTVALAKELGVGVVVSHLPLRIAGLALHTIGFGAWGSLVPLPWTCRGSYYQALNQGRLKEAVSSGEIIIALENMPARYIFGKRFNAFWFNRPAELLRFSHLTLDTTHLGTWGLDPVKVYRHLGKRVAHVHLSNFDGREHRSPAWGRMDLAELLRMLEKTGYRGSVSVECDPDALNAGDEALCLGLLREALSFCRAHFSPRREPTDEGA